MIGYEMFCKIRRLADQKHLSAAQVAVFFYKDTATTEKWIQYAAYQQRRACKRPSKSFSKSKHKVTPAVIPSSRSWSVCCVRPANPLI